MTISPRETAHLTVCPLRHAQIDQAFASLQLTGPRMTLAAWRHYAEARIGAAPSTAGIISIQCDRSYIHGLLGYEIVRIGLDRYMTIDLVTSADHIDDGVAWSMMEAAERIASDHRCSAIHVDLPDFKAAKIIPLEPRSLALMCRRGYIVESMHLSKTLYP